MVTRKEGEKIREPTISIIIRTVPHKKTAASRKYFFMSIMITDVLFSERAGSILKVNLYKTETKLLNNFTYINPWTREPNILRFIFESFLLQNFV